MDKEQPELINIPLYIDDRGTVRAAFDNMDRYNIKRTYIVRNWRSGLIRAWHGHRVAGTYIHVVKGTAKVCAKDMDDNSKVVVKTLSGAKPQLFYIPPGWYNGTMTLQEDTRMLIYSTVNLEDAKEDDHRSPVMDCEMDSIWKVRNR